MRLITLLVVTALLPFVALAQAADPGIDPGGFLLEIVTAIQGGDWRAVAVLAAIGLTWAAKRYGAKAWPFLGTARGGAALALVLGVIGTLVPAVAGGAPLTLKLGIDALLFGLTSIGGWVGVRRLIWGDVSAAVDAAAKPIPLTQTATLADLGAEVDKPVK